MTEQKDLEKALEAFRELLHKYDELAKDVLTHHNLKEGNHHLHELRARLEHLKYLLDEAGIETEERKKHFLKEHAEAMQHVVEHIFHINRHLEQQNVEAIEYAEQMRELYKVYRELHELYEKIREHEEAQKHLHDHEPIKPLPSPFPPWHRDENAN